MTPRIAAMEILEQASALFGAGQIAASAALLETISANDAAYPHALYLRAMVLASMGDQQEASSLLEQACRSAPDNTGMRSALARLYAGLGRPADALDLLSGLLAAGAATAAIHLDCGTLARRLGNPTLARQNYDAALALDPLMADAWTGKGNLLHEEREYARALRFHNVAIAVQAGNVAALCNRAATLNKLGRTEEALADNRSALEFAPRSAAAWSACGCTLAAMDRLEEAMQCFDEALAIDTAHLHARANRASTLAELGNARQALVEFDQALAITHGRPQDLAALHSKKGMVQLSLGDQEGWLGYEYRLQLDPCAARHDARAQRWTGVEALAGKRILLWGEQGLGDTIQFCRYASSLAHRGAQVLLEVPGALRTLCRQLPVHAVYACGEALPSHDFHIPMMSMPLALRHSTGMTGARHYLQAPVKAVEKWAQALPPRGERPRIGITCSGALHHSRNARRSIPLEAYRPLMNHADLVVLQPELTARDSIAATQMASMLKPVLDPTDFADVAGLIANTDLVISVDTSIAHLAGAMGHPLWLLLPWQAEWRWQHGRSDTPWYGSARLFRQTTRSCWGTVIVDVINALSTQNS